MKIITVSSFLLKPVVVRYNYYLDIVDLKKQLSKQTGYSSRNIILIRNRIPLSHNYLFIKERDSVFMICKACPADVIFKWRPSI